MNFLGKLKAPYYSDSNQAADPVNVHCPKLSFKQRIIGFAVCVLVGLLLAICSWFTFGNWTRFGVIMTLGNIVSLCGTAFLVGPKSQVKMMFKKVRIAATIIYLLTMILTMVAALALHNPGLTVVACILQYLALTWYGLSYIPYARTAVKKVFSSIV
eukprot:TRINITY_DN11880_c0_g1_i1.p1 TRINITY_DN11880_c0_g1~~TRINITY_DN11880_c0_g1_i1.p1  ORF type:complete len:157 (+),score=17.55 TRINITY_DN11880_c0_g1_i1:53-523(+)